MFQLRNSLKSNDLPDAEIFHLTWLGGRGRVKFRHNFWLSLTTKGDTNAMTKEPQFVLEFDEDGCMVFIAPNGEESIRVGYQGISHLRYDGIDYFAVTDYYSGTLPTECVFSLTRHPTTHRSVRVDREGEN